MMMTMMMMMMLMMKNCFSEIIYQHKALSLLFPAVAIIGFSSLQIWNKLGTVFERDNQILTIADLE